MYGHTSLILKTSNLRSKLKVRQLKGETLCDFVCVSIIGHFCRLLLRENFHHSVLGGPFENFECLLTQKVAFVLLFRMRKRIKGKKTHVFACSKKPIIHGFSEEQWGFWSLPPPPPSPHEIPLPRVRFHPTTVVIKGASFSATF